MGSLGDVSACPGAPRPARLSVGVVSAGRVGTAIGSALERAGHVVSGCAAGSQASRERARVRLPESRVLPVADVVAGAELLVLAVPDTELAALVGELAADADRCARGYAGRIVLHTSGANGIGVLEPLAERGAVCLAVHPAMTFTGEAADTDRLASACFGVTAADEVGAAIAQSLVLEIGGEPVMVPEASRTLYHAALAHGSNHLVTLVRDAASALSVALRGGPGDPAAASGAAAPEAGGTIAGEDGAPERILAPLLFAALDNALRVGDRALTGPVARGDSRAVAAHQRVLTEADPGVGRAYRALALRTAERSGAPPALLEALADPSAPDQERTR